MASEDVIELGSSDDDTEPAPKKSKPKPDAMVCIPRYKLNEVTIKPPSAKVKVIAGPGKSGLSTKNDPILKVLSATEGVTISKATTSPLRLPTDPTSLKRLPIAQNIFPPKQIITPKSSVVLKAPTPFAKKKTTITRVPTLLTNPFANVNKHNGKPVHKVISKPLLNLPKSLKIQYASASQNKFTALPHNPIKISNSSPVILNTIHQPTNQINLPPSITVKRTSKQTYKPVVYMKRNTNATDIKQANVPTVELDDDEISVNEPAAPGPAWYLRPEEQEEISTLEEENNKEPEGSKMIEITIEDSPIKPVTNKRTCEVGTELAITIDDSPIKAVADKNGSLSESDEECVTPKSPPNSKKKLEYPKEDESREKTLEIEIEIPIGEGLELDTKSVDKDGNNDIPKASVAEQTESTEKNDSSKADTNSKEATKEPSISAQSEFHPVYQNFIDVCFQLENSDDMNKIVEKKIKGYYRQVPKEYTESEEFIDMVRSKVVAMKASPEKMYLYIKDVVDELNMQRKRAKAQPQVVNLETVPEESDQFQFGEENEYDSKRQRQIRKLEKTIKKLHRAIQKLEEHEVDFDDEDDSVYLLTERFADRQNQMKLEGEEIGDKEAEESPVESEDEDANDDESASLENKGKRKERLKRLIEEISKGPSEGKENQPLEKPNTSPTEETVKGTEVKGDKEDSETLKSKNIDKDIQNAETFSVSSENSKDFDLESDVDELHLLQKLHKSNEDTSTLDSSDSDDSLIAISDSLDSDNDNKELSDVISIENSSYSDSEADKMNSVPSNNKDIVEIKSTDTQKHNETEPQNNELELVFDDSDMNPTNDMNVECSKSVEDNLLASSDNESGDNKQAETVPVDIEIPSEDVDILSTQVDALSPSDTCVNLKDDLISIDETVVGNVAVNPKENQVNELPVIAVGTEINNKDHFKDGKESRGDVDTVSLKFGASSTSKELQKEIVSSTSAELELPEPMDVDEPQTVDTVKAHSHTGKPEVAL
ncbi:hypothetical protein HF086_007544 [Spodoptera exigua]|uniref:Death domain-associated protein 6 n=1 Tax=Spodoptera exigua TaxID=7107 RepID=A0A922MU32_SPOEX|nr:hypothetical protein HF086_007544 [Spodoptera exigua]